MVYTMQQPSRKQIIEMIQRATEGTKKEKEKMKTPWEQLKEQIQENEKKMDAKSEDFMRTRKKFEKNLEIARLIDAASKYPWGPSFMVELMEREPEYDFSGAGLYFKIEDIWRAGRSLVQLRRLGYKPQEELYEEVISPKDWLQAGYTIQELKEVYSEYELIRMLKAGREHSITEIRVLLKCGWGEFLDTGYTAQELYNAGCDLLTLRLELGANAKEIADIKGQPRTILRDIGFSPRDLFVARVKDERILGSGYTAEEITAAGLVREEDAVREMTFEEMTTFLSKKEK